MAELDHLQVVGFTQSQMFRSMLSARRPAAPARDRIPHGQQLLDQITALAQQSLALSQQRQAFQLPPQGMTIVLEISPRGHLDYKQLEWKRDGIEVLNVTERGATDIVVLFIPDGRLGALEKRIRDYLEKQTKRNIPKNAPLIDVIDTAPPPDHEDRRWFQLWLRQLPEGPAETRTQFARLARQLDIEVERGFLKFPGRVVVAANASRTALEQAVELLDMLAEIRSVPPTAEFFLADLTPAEQADWVGNLRDRITFTADNSGSTPFVALLDTGVNFGHPLLSGGLHEEDMHAVHADWVTIDQRGHGTQMAGLVLHGNLTEPLGSVANYEVGHRLESVKILPDDGTNSEHLYGWITRLAAGAVEIPHPERRRIFAMMTTSEGETTGTPSEWSSTIDHLAFGPIQEDLDNDAAQDEPRLFVLSAGNLPWDGWSDYPSVNLTTPIENPGQAWNALTVGACTFLAGIDGVTYPSYNVIAASGALSPSSSTSLLWKPQWPYKPDVVAEGGNGCLEAGIHVVVGPDSVRMLTVAHDMAVTLLAETGDTSAAAAEVTRLCAQIAARYPSYWPETIRALVIHGARHTLTMRSELPPVPLVQHKLSLLRKYGYGAINAANALDSAARRPTLVLQETIKPYRLDGNELRLNNTNLHALPWPQALLQVLGEAPVTMRITLSYFVAPNPGQRGWQSRFRYQSHGLRFAVKGSTETADRFMQRINRIEREAAAVNGEIEAMHDPDNDGWFLGPKLQTRGSVHSDAWTGTAAQLAEKSHIAVFPVGGWWKDWKDAAQYNKSVRYSLLVTLEVMEDLNVDLYVPIQTQIAVAVAIPAQVAQGAG
jgi:hypothetical protein